MYILSLCIVIKRLQCQDKINSSKLSTIEKFLRGGNYKKSALSKWKQY